MDEKKYETDVYMRSQLTLNDRECVKIARDRLNDILNTVGDVSMPPMQRLCRIQWLVNEIDADLKKFYYRMVFPVNKGEEDWK